MYTIEFNNNVLLLNQDFVLDKTSVNKRTGNIIKTGDNEYHIDIPAGTYNIRVSAGDLNDDGDVNLHCELNGEKQIPLWINDRSIGSIEYRAVIEDEGLQMNFSGKYVCLQKIEIALVIKNVPTIVSTDINVTKESKSVNLHFKEAGTYQLYRELILERPCMLNKDYSVKLEEAFTGDRYVDTDVELCASYRYSAVCVDELLFEGERSSLVQVDIIDSKRKCPVLDNCYVNKVQDTSVELKFSGDEETLYYRIYRKSEFSNFILLSETKENTFIDNKVITDRAYTYGIIAVGLGGVSDMSIIVSDIAAPRRKRQMERLNRGLIAIKTDSGIFLSWRLCAYEYEENRAFNIYADGIRLNDKPLTGPTNYIDRNGTVNTEYSIKSIVNGMELDDEYKAKPWNNGYMDIPLNKPEPYTTPDGHTYEYTANDASIADLDGDGEYEIVLKWDCNGKDNSHKGYSGIVFLDAYKLDGTMLWRINMGKNIRCGAHYTQFLVYDFDGDSRAEVIMKTADGTKDGTGRVIGDATVDYRNKDGFIIEGPEYLTLFDGLTGAAIDTVDYDPPRGNVADWGDSWGNRVDRFLATPAYLDGIHPSAIMCRGYYDNGRPTVLVAYDVIDKKLIKRWKFLADKNQNTEYTNQGFHNLAVGDVDGDGCDEIVYGACVIDHDGTGLYSTGLEHGDAMHLGKFSPDTVGLDYYGIHEHADCPYGIEARDPGTGSIRFGKFTGMDTGRGLTAKIDPRYRGNQIWAFEGAGLYNYDGTFISDKSPSAINFAIWWDGDLIRELLDHEWHGYETNIGIPKIYKWDYINEKLNIVLNTEGVLSNNGSKGNPCIQASIFGDWREEAVFRSTDSTFLRIYTTTDYTEHRIYTFMHDPIYRLGIAWQNTAYNQPPHTSFYIGDDMGEIPIPECYYI